MWLLHIKREQLQDTLHLAISGNLNKVTHTKKLQEMSLNLASKICLIWDKDPQVEFSFPLIVVENGTKRDFLAWLATYFPPLLPITRDCRILEHSTFSTFYKRDHKSNHTHKYVGATVGLIISEAILNNTANNTQRNITFRDCLETFSFSFGKALFNGATVDELSHVEILWRKIQKNSNRTHILPNNAIVRRTPWSILTLLVNQGCSLEENWSNDANIILLTKSIENGQQIPINIFSEISKSLDVPKKLLESTGKGSRESRIVALEQSYSILNKKSLSRSHLAQFVSGFLANQLDPGTLNYFSLIISEKYPSNEVALWYGFLGGLHPHTTIFLSESGLGWSIANELLRKETIFNCLNCDLDAEELDMLVDSENNLSTNKARRAGSLTVELIPGVQTLLVTGANAQKKTPVQQSLFEQKLPTQDVKRILYDFDNVMQQIRNLKNNVKKLSAQEPKSKYASSKKKTKK